MAQVPQVTESGNVLSKTIPIQLTDASNFDDSFSFLKERFALEMKRMDEAMNKFSLDLINLYGQSSTTGLASGNWETLSNSPLIHGEGENKALKLQFDLSQFNPDEIKVQIAGDVLVITARHSEKTDTTSVVREFKREFMLPRGIDPNNVHSSLSRDGVLRVNAPLPQMQTVLDKTFLAVQEVEPSSIAIDSSAVKSKEAPLVIEVTEREASPKTGTRKNSFETKRSKEHKKAKEQMAAHDETHESTHESTYESKHLQKALEISKEKSSRKNRNTE